MRIGWKMLSLKLPMSIGQQLLTACVASADGEKVKLSDGHNNIQLLLTIAGHFNLPARNLQRDNYINGCAFSMYTYSQRISVYLVTQYVFQR